MENILLNALNKHIPITKVKYNKYKQKKNNWITKGIMISLKFRDKLYKRLKQTAHNSFEFLHIKQNLTTYNRILKKSIREAKLEFYQVKFNKYKFDPKQTINEVVNKSNKSNLPDYFIIDTNKVTHKTTIVNHFYKYFGNIGLNMANSIVTDKSKSYKMFLKRPKVTTLNFVNIDESEVKSVINNLRSKYQVIVMMEFPQYYLKS